jgi:hypothetical protein
LAPGESLCKAPEPNFGTASVKERRMNIDDSNANPAMDMPAHIKTYRSFVRFVQFGVLAVVIILVLLAVFTV